MDFAAAERCLNRQGRILAAGPWVLTREGYEVPSSGRMSRCPLPDYALKRDGKEYAPARVAAARPEVEGMR